MTERTGDPFRDLADSSLNFLQRFGVDPADRSAIEDRIMIFEEEVRELTEAVREGTDLNHIGEEAADVIVTIITMCHSAGVDTEALIEQAYRVVAKNDAKTHETHIFKDGKIRRRKA